MTTPFIQAGEYPVPADYEAGGLPVRSQDQPLTAMATRSQVLTAGAAGVPLTTIDTGTTQMLLTIETSTVRMRLDGTAPTATTGHPLPAGTIMTLTLADFSLLRFFAAAAATVHYTCMKAIA